MNRLIKFAVPALALGMFALVPNVVVHADDAPAASQPSKATGSVTVRVVDAQGNPVEGANVTVAAARVKGQKKNNGGAKQKAESLGQGKTDAQGLVTLSGIPEGSYRATAKVKGGGLTGHEDVIVTATLNGPNTPAATPPVTITVKPGKKAAAPATQPA